MTKIGPSGAEGGHSVGGSSSTPQESGHASKGSSAAQTTAASQASSTSSTSATTTTATLSAIMEAGGDTAEQVAAALEEESTLISSKKGSKESAEADSYAASEEVSKQEAEDLSDSGETESTEKTTEGSESDAPIDQDAGGSGGGDSSKQQGSSEDAEVSTTSSTSSTNSVSTTSTADPGTTEPTDPEVTDPETTKGSGAAPLQFKKEEEDIAPVEANASNLLSGAITSNSAKSIGERSANLRVLAEEAASSGPLNLSANTSTSASYFFNTAASAMARGDTETAMANSSIAYKNVAADLLSTPTGMRDALSQTLPPEHVDAVMYVIDGMKSGDIPIPGIEVLSKLGNTVNAKAVEDPNATASGQEAVAGNTVAMILGQFSAAVSDNQVNMAEFESVAAEISSGVAETSMDVGAGQLENLLDAIQEQEDAQKKAKKDKGLLGGLTLAASAVAVVALVGATALSGGTMSVGTGVLIAVLVGSMASQVSAMSGGPDVQQQGMNQLALGIQQMARGFGGDMSKQDAMIVASVTVAAAMIAGGGVAASGSTATAAGATGASTGASTAAAGTTAATTTGATTATTASTATTAASTTAATTTTTTAATTTTTTAATTTSASGSAATAGATGTSGAATAGGTASTSTAAGAGSTAGTTGTAGAAASSGATTSSAASSAATTATMTQRASTMVSSAMKTFSISAEQATLALTALSMTGFWENASTAVAEDLGANDQQILIASTVFAVFGAILTAGAGYATMTSSASRTAAATTDASADVAVAGSKGATTGAKAADTGVEMIDMSAAAAQTSKNATTAATGADATADAATLGSKTTATGAETGKQADEAAKAAEVAAQTTEKSSYITKENVNLLMQRAAVLSTMGVDTAKTVINVQLSQVFRKMESLSLELADIKSLMTTMNYTTDMMNSLTTQVVDDYSAQVKALSESQSSCLQAQAQGMEALANVLGGQGAA